MTQMFWSYCILAGMVVSGFRKSQVQAKPFRLTCRGKDGTPPTTRRVQPLRLGSEQFNWNVNETLVVESR
jgi:hypothetical protein